MVPRRWSGATNTAATMITRATHGSQVAARSSHRTAVRILGRSGDWNTVNCTGTEGTRLARLKPASTSRCLTVSRNTPRSTEIVSPELVTGPTVDPVTTA